MRREYRYGRRTRDLRLQRGWTQEHLAEVAGVDVRTVQRVERDQTAGPEALMAVADALGVEVKDLQKAYWVAERKPLRALTIRRAQDFAEVIRRAHHEYTYQIYAPLRSGTEDEVKPLMNEIFADIWAMEPGDEMLLESWIDSIATPVDELRRDGLVFYSIQEQRDVFLKGRNPGERIPMEDWTRAYFLLVSEHGAFHLGDQHSTEPLHRFSDTCQEAIQTVYRTLHEEFMVGQFDTPVHAMATRGDSLRWCDSCFPPDASGVRIGWNDLEAITGRSKLELLSLLEETADLRGPS